MSSSRKNIRDLYLKKMFSLRDDQYLQFNQKIIHSQYKMIGVRTPILRKIAKDVFIHLESSEIYSLFIMKPKYYEEVLLQGFVLAHFTDYLMFKQYFLRWIDLVDNWAICDMAISSMKLIKKNQEDFFPLVLSLLEDEREFVVRIGIVILMNYYLERDKVGELILIIDKIHRTEYYIQMAIAWFISVAFVSFPEEIILYLQNNHLDDFTQNQAIQKIRDSYRVSLNDKKRVALYRR